MGKEVKAGANERELTINLFGPGMTAMHKAGLAGLWMTLEALEKENNGKAFSDGSGSWECTPTSVTLWWSGEPKAFFNTLFKQSFRIDKNGLLWFPALGDPMQHAQYSSILQEAVLGTILQHGGTRRSDPSQKPGGNLSFPIDDKPFTVKFHRVTFYKHQKEPFDPAVVSRVAGWLFPGGAVRHSGWGEYGATALEEPPERALALRYLIVGAFYFRIGRTRYCLVLPEIGDLQKYAQARQAFVRYGVADLEAAGIADAGFRVLTELESQDLLEDLRTPACRVISFGTLPWSKQQKSRSNLVTVRPQSALDLRTFDLCRQMFRARLIRPERGEAFWDVPLTPDLVAGNLMAGRKWWEGFAETVTDSAHILKYERGGLANMIENQATFRDGPERTFVLACMEAWRRRLGQISDKAKRERSSFRDQANREFTRTTVAFSRCKNAASLREAVIDFWSRGGGSLKPLQDRWHDVLTLMGEQNWRKGRDLALLALASYKPATKEETEAFGSKEKEEEKDE